MRALLCSLLLVGTVSAQEAPAEDGGAEASGGSSEPSPTPAPTAPAPEAPGRADAPVSGAAADSAGPAAVSGGPEAPSAAPAADGVSPGAAAPASSPDASSAGAASPGASVSVDPAADAVAPAHAPASGAAALRPDEPDPRTEEGRAWRLHLRRRAKWERRVEHRMRLPVLFAMQLSGAREEIGDPALAAHGAPQSLETFHFGLDVFPHPQLAASLLLGVPSSYGVTLRQSDAWASTDVQVRTIAGSVKGILAPAWFVLRPFARVGGGAHEVQVTMQGGTAADDRTRTAPAGFFLAGGGLEVTTPRKKDGLVLPWGLGFFVEGGARLGGGGERGGVPAARFGDWGSVDVGPGYVRAGWVFLF